MLTYLLYLLRYSRCLYINNKLISLQGRSVHKQQAGISIQTSLRTLPGDCHPWRISSIVVVRPFKAESYLEQYWLKPVLNWANVCSPNILRTVRRTMIRFLIELLVRRIWFGQSKLRSQLARNEMQASARTCGRRAADSMIENVG